VRQVTIPENIGDMALIMLDVAYENPDNVNPRSRDKEGTCVYTSEDGTKHCFIGQCLAHMQLPIPDYDIRMSVKPALHHTNIAGLFTVEVLDMMKYIQERADNEDCPIQWSELIPAIKAYAGVN
jgi:hypothetical protein